MKTKPFILFACIAIMPFALLALGDGNRECGTESSVSGKSGRSALFSFAPNQLAANTWYRPGGSLINGHLDESFGNGDLWPELRGNLKASGGTFSLFAAEIGYLSTQAGLIPLLKADGIPVSVEMPGFTQCIPGTELAQAELNGKAAGSAEGMFARIFRIVDPEDRPDPDGNGWFRTQDGQDFVPDEILFDERMPNLCPEFDPVILASAKGSWEERKNAARKSNPYTVPGEPFDSLLSRLRQDYVDYLLVARAKWGDRMPEIGLHWNVVAGWEWRDENGIDSVHARDPHYFDTPENFWKMATERPSGNSVRYCNLLVDALATAGFPPKIVLMDVDWMYSVPYLTRMLKAHKEELRRKGIQMGINIVDASSYLADGEELYYDGTTLVRRQGRNADPNLCYENTLVAIMQFLRGSGIYERGMQIRVTSWLPRPKETGAQVNEKTPGSLAHTANEIFRLLN